MPAKQSLLAAVVLVAVVAVPSRAPAGVEVADVVEQSLPGVVLLLNYRLDGKIGYGSGIIVDDSGLVLTNLHVVSEAKGLGAMLHDPERVSYSPLDGGLGRYLHEYRKHIVGVRLLKADPTVDLALVRIAADTKAYPKLAMSRDRCRPGEEILVMGHPKEAVWSFTSGSISAVHQGVIQHDAAVNMGNSGGPLISKKTGRVIAINTAKLFGDAEGVAFARPVRLADRLMDAASGADDLGTFDLTSPAAAVKSCLRAAELGSFKFLDCIDWDYKREIFETALRDFDAKYAKDGAFVKKMTNKMNLLVAVQKIDLKAQLVGGDWEAAVLEQLEAQGMLASEATARPSRAATIKKDFAWKKIQALVADGEKTTIAYDQRLLKRNGIKEPVSEKNLSGYGVLRDLIKMGIRVEKTAHPAEDRAWIWLVCRNKDASPCNYSELRVRKQDRWLLQLPPTVEDEAKLPKGWPSPLFTHADWADSIAGAIATGIKGAAGAE